MQNLRILNVKVIDSSNIDVTFTDNLTSNLVTSNVSITSDASNIPESQVLQVKVTGNLLSINCQPLTPQFAYYLTFASVTNHIFESVNGGARISEDGVSNKFLIIAPMETDNPVKTYLDNFLQNNIYSEDDNSIVKKYVKSLAINLSRALYDIRQLKNENYLTFNVADEVKVRSAGPYDRLDEEAAYEVVRVGRTPTGTNASALFTFDFFPTYPVTLQRQSNVEMLTPNSTDDAGTFNINSLVFNFSNTPVTRVNSIVFTLNTATPVYEYDIAKLGYQIKDSRYDKDYSFSYLQLDTNQIRVSDRILLDPLFDLHNIISVTVIYESKNLGTVVDPSTINVYTTLDAIREVLPPIINVFSLKHAPITDVANNVYSIKGVTFTDPNSSGALPHPAFVSEIPFRLNALPAVPGQYAVDYNTGTVYVYGANILNDGTGPYPPLATYKYRYTYKSELDYTYDPDLLDIVALPNGSLVNQAGKVDFKYEEVLVPGLDYKASLHSEVLDERIENNLVALNVLRVKQSPITNVFKIYNETSGEIYTLDRWNDDKIYFRYNTPPRIVEQLSERASFTTESNELLFVNTTINSPSRIFKILLNNNTIISFTEDSLASSFNTSLVFSDGYVFASEKWFNRDLSESTNLTRLQNVGEYMVDYVNGIAYVAVFNTQNLNIGTVTYKINSITTQRNNIISVEDLYYRISPLNSKNKLFNYTTFGVNTIVPETFDYADELYLNNTVSSPYQVFNKSVGIFLGSSFLPGVTNQVKFVRAIYEYTDLLNSVNPINFSNFSSSNSFNITVNPVSKQVFGNVQHNISDGYFVTIDENVPYLSSNITYSFTVTRLSDGAALWNGSGVVVPGILLKLKLPGINSPVNGDRVNINYSFTINDLSRLVVDYNKGDYFVDYTYLNDEIIISYEYGDNVLDFRQNTNLPVDTTYYVSYKAGALRDALLKNFGTLVDVPQLASFDVDFDRERYREALIAALTSFVQGPTIGAIKNIGKTISHIEPQITESAFINWSLGSSLLTPQSITTEGSFQTLPAKHGLGVLINDHEQSINFPVSSNLRLEEGTFETWIAPQWDGLDSQSRLTFTITRNGQPIADNKVFIGVAEYHPVTEGKPFSLSTQDNVHGTPNTNKDGIFIYYDKDISGNFNRWFIRVIDGYVDGYTPAASYAFKVLSTGSFYDSKSTVLPKPSNLTIFTGVNSLNFSITGGPAIDDGITFLSDQEHYLLDFGEEASKNRLSIFKDVSGYMNFRIFDKDKASYIVSNDISAWRAGDLHHVAVSWKLNTANNRDEMHLFIDGFEVPNIIKYGQNLQPYLHEKFRTVNPEEVVGLSSRDIVSSIDLHTTSGSTTVSSSLNFGTYNIFIGDTINIDEVGFSSTGYTIAGISGQTLTLNSPMPLTLTNAKFSINRTSYTVITDINTAPNIAVTTIHSFVSGNDAVGTSGLNTITSSSTNFTTAGVKPGYLIHVNNSSLETTYTILQVSGNTITINGVLPVNVTSQAFQVYSNTENEIPGVRALRPSYSISKDGYFNNVITISNNVYAKDLIVIRTLGLNSRNIRRQYYVWSDNQENVLMTRLPSPISLDEAKITKVIVPLVAIGPANSTLSTGLFQSNNIPADPTTNSQVGRTINVTIGGTNTDFTTPVTVTINGVVGYVTINETISFSDYGVKSSVNKFISVNYIKVSAKPINSTRAALTVIAKEKYSITKSEDSGLVPVIRYSYQIGAGTTLKDDGYGRVRDEKFLFSGLDTNNYLLIQSPNSVAGFYIIDGFTEDRKTLFITPTRQATQLPLPAFTDGYYQILNVNQYRSGLQNGFFTLESSVLPSQAYFLEHGFYELDYDTYARIKVNTSNNKVFIGSDFKNNNHLNGIVDQVKIYSVMLTDTRIGESIPVNQRSITKDFNSLKALKSDPNTLMLIDFDTFPFVNSAGFYINPNRNKQHFLSSEVINDNFTNSIAVLNKPIILSNDGILDTRKEGTIEFWMNPIFDTANDPNIRFYFDAYGAVTEEVVSVNNVSVKLSAPASQILSVKLKAGDPNIDYFAGGKIEIDTQRAIQESQTSFSNSTIIVTRPILQVISVKVVGDFNEVDYFADGSIGTDGKTIYLGKLLPSTNLPVVVVYQTTENKNVTKNTQVIRLNRKLPYQNTGVVVSYIPKGLQGDRMSLFKDLSGYINFAITASGTDYIIRGPTRWAKDTWHRVRVSYSVNGGKGNDKLQLFLDGYEYTNLTFGTHINYGKFPFVYGSSAVGGSNYDGYGFLENITFKDPINELFIGSQYTGENPIFSLLDNFRISNVFRPTYAPYGEALDLNYNSNLDTVFPVTSDLFTTYLMSFEKMVTLNTDFAILKNRDSGIFDFSVNIFDSFGIVDSSVKSKEILETLIKILKPANSKVFIQYTK